MQTFSIRELRERSGDLSREAEQGRLALVTRHGRPLFVSVPFTEELLQAGVHAALAVNLFKSGDLTSGRAAKLARMGLADFLAHVSMQGIPVVDHDHIQFDNACDVVSRTVVLADHKIIATPMEGGLRVGGTVEIAGLKRPPSPRRIWLLEQLARSNFDGLGDINVSSWMGHRPCMPDSVPRIGASIAYRGLWMAFGHGHLGVTDSLGTAQRIADHIFKPAIVGSPN